MAWGWSKSDALALVREMRWSYFPPLVVYCAAGVSAFTGIIESLFVKETLALTASFLAGLEFWAGIPWVLKMPWGIWSTSFGDEDPFLCTLAQS
jgi:hypothetical protein